MKQPLIAGNWKMNGSRKSAIDLIASILTEAYQFPKIEMAVFPPFVYLSQTEELLTGSGVNWGAQNASPHKNGAYTGEISLEMLKDFNCKYVLVGHSERRRQFGDSPVIVAEKFAAAMRAGFTPVLCVGETEEQHDRGLTWQVIQEQLEVVFELKDNHSSLRDIVIAYEPVWAIGTGKSASPEEAQEVHLAIRNRLGEYDWEIASKIRIIYGGSVTPENIADLMAMPDIDGALVGGASLDAKKFLEIGRKCNSLY
jgi:triosephosphate isomerase